MTLVLPLLAALILPQQGLFNKVVPRPTGENGYEEYVRAAEIASSPAVKSYLAWQPRRDASQIAANLPAAEAAVMRALIGKTPLQAKRQLMKDNGRILDFIRKGNEKPVFSPRATINHETTFPELLALRAAARFSVACADALLADGRSSEAARVMTDTLKMGANIQDGVIISYLVGIACEAIVLSALNDQLDRYSEADWRTFVSATGQILDRPNPLSNIMRGEAQLIMRTVSDVMKDRKIAEAVFEMDDAAFGKRVKAMNEAQLAGMVRDLQKELEAWLADLEGIFRQGESKWRSAPRPAPSSDGQKLFEMLLPSIDSSFNAQARIRTQLRLLRLHALVQIYRWHWSELPASLDLVATRAELYDPLTETPFNFERLDNGYRIFSKGSDQTGEIELRYRNQRNNDRSIDPP